VGKYMKDKNSAWETATNKDFMYMYFTLYLNHWFGTNFDWFTMNQEQKDLMKKTADGWDWGDEDPDWME